MVDLELYRLFVTVANEGNITRASEILHISQPAISKQIHNLEYVLNTQLFERSNTGVKLTIDGNKLYFKIKDALSLIEHVEEDFKDNRTIRLGTRNTILSKVFSKGLTDFYNTYPNETIDIKILEINEMLNQLNNGLLDVVLTKRIKDDNFENIKFIGLGTLHVAFITKYGSKYTNKIFSLNELKKELIYTNSINSNAVSVSILKELFNSDDLRNFPNLKSVTINTIVEILKKEDALGFITTEFIKEELDSKKLAIVKTDFEIPSNEYGIYYNKNNKFQALEYLIDCIIKECKQ